MLRTSDGLFLATPRTDSPHFNQEESTCRLTRIFVVGTTAALPQRSTEPFSEKSTVGCYRFRRDGGGRRRGRLAALLTTRRQSIL